MFKRGKMIKGEGLSVYRGEDKSFRSGAKRNL